MSNKTKEGSIIEPRVLKGFRDFLPAMEIPKKAIIGKLETHFSSYGFVPIDTPVLEYTEVLLGKGGGETDKQIFHFKDNGERDVALRFDLTVPFGPFSWLNTKVTCTALQAVSHRQGVARRKPPERTIPGVHPV